MGALLRVVSLARSARTASKLKVRQPLAELVVASGSDVERAAVEQFRDHVLEELNVKKVTVCETVVDWCTVTIAVNKKLVGPKYGPQMGAIVKGLGQVDAVGAAAKVTAGECVAVPAGTESILLEPGELEVTKDYGSDWAAAEDQHTVALLDKRITTELRHEGLARDVVRNVQNLRKEMDLNIEDRIVLSLRTESADLAAGIDAFRDYIARETLAVELTAEPPSDPTGSTEVKIGGAKLAIGIRKRS
jgi:isoleucyl-tRNA synthetase